MLPKASSLLPPPALISPLHAKILGIFTVTVKLKLEGESKPHEARQCASVWVPELVQKGASIDAQPLLEDYTSVFSLALMALR